MLLKIVIAQNQISCEFLVERETENILLKLPNLNNFLVQNEDLLFQLFHDI